VRDAGERLSRFIAAYFQQIWMNVDIVSGGINRKRQTMSVCDGAAMIEQVVLLALHLSTFGQLRTFVYLQIVQTNCDCRDAG
jgi:hypothetical protein